MLGVVQTAARGRVQSGFAAHILVQAGPLWKPQELRSMDTPSFRLIGFGRGTRKEDEDGLSFAKTVELEEYAERCALPHPAPSEWTL